MNINSQDPVNVIDLTIHPSHVRSILRGLLYSIFFHRTLENFEPETVEILDTHIASPPGKDIYKEVESKIDEFERKYLDAGAHEGQIAVVFLQRKAKKGWFAITEELIPWEEHLIHLNFTTPSRRTAIAPAGHATTVESSPSEELNRGLMQILTFCAERKMAVPPLVGVGNNVSHQIMIAPPPPSELFAPSSPPLLPTRLTSPPPALPPTTATTTTTIVAAAAGAGVTATISASPASSGANTHQNTHHTQHQSGTYAENPYRRRSASPAPVTGTSASAGTGTGAGASGGMGYLEQAKEGFRAVRAGAGAVAGWGGRGAFGRGGV